jgi:hypothetical protein
MLLIPFLRVLIHCQGSLDTYQFSRIQLALFPQILSCRVEGNVCLAREDTLQRIE